MAGYELVLNFWALIKFTKAHSNLRIFSKVIVPTDNDDNNNDDDRQD